MPCVGAKLHSGYVDPCWIILLAFAQTEEFALVSVIVVAPTAFVAPVVVCVVALPIPPGHFCILSSVRALLMGTVTQCALARPANHKKVAYGDQAASFIPRLLTLEKAHYQLLLEQKWLTGFFLATLILTIDSVSISSLQFQLILTIDSVSIVLTSIDL